MRAAMIAAQSERARVSKPDVRMLSFEVSVANFYGITFSFVEGTFHKIEAKPRTLNPSSGIPDNRVFILVAHDYFPPLLA